jgi:DNA-directed RNA polymerase beta subunit
MKAGRWTIELNNAHVVPEEFSSREQKKALMEGRTLSERVKGDLIVKDSAGQVTDQAKGFTLLRLPYFTPRHTFILDGTEYAVANLLRPKSGVYVHRRGNQLLEAQFNMAKGANLKMSMDQEKGLLYITPSHTSSKIGLYPVLKALGVPHQDISRAWGSEVAEINNKKFSKPEKHVDTLYDVILERPGRPRPATPEARADALRAYFDTTKMDPDVNEVTLGHPFDKASPQALLSAGHKLLDVHKNARNVDDRDALEFKTFHSVDDFIRERLGLTARSMRNKFGWKLDAAKGKLRDAIPSGMFTKSVNGFLTGSSLSAVPTQINPMELISQASKVTMLGEGAIPTERAIPIEARDAHMTHLGILDEVRTPESFHAGVDVRAAIGTMRDDHNNLYGTYRNVKTGKDEILSIKEASKSVIAFPGQDLSPGKIIETMHNHLMGHEPSDRVTHEIRHATDMFSPTTNLLPLIGSMQGNRSLMASKHQEQALPLVHREAPNVQVESWAPGHSVEQEFAKIIVPTAREDGVITKIDGDYIHLAPRGTKTSAAGGVMKLHYDQDLPLAAKTYLTNNLIVKQGDEVKKGQLLAESNFTKDGTLALGTNLRVAYVAARGLNSNDGLVVSQNAANKLTSEHMYQHVLDISGETQAGRERHKTYFGPRYTAKQYANLDDDGVIKPGTTVYKGDPLLVAVRPNVVTGDAALLGKLSKSLVKPYREVVETWNSDNPGVVSDVAKTEARHSVTVKTEEPLQIADKITNRHGAKGVIAQIIPDDQMLQDESGHPIDVLFTSAGVITRINPSQIIEAALGKVAAKTGKPIIAPQYMPGNAVKFARDKLKEAGLSDKETVTDPVTGKKIPNVFVGNAYILKLMKTAESGWSASQPGRYDYNEQPAKGGDDGAKGIGRMEFDGLVSHNARNILRESATIKSQRNDEFWRAIQLGLPTPAPKTSFVYDKLHSMLTGAGIKVNKSGSRLALGPLTDADITKMSSGALPDPSKMIRAKDLKPETGGLFDPARTGGASGTKWSHVDLVEPIVNPVFEEPVKKLLNLTQDQFTEHVGKGGNWFKSALGAIDMDKEIKNLRDEARRLKGTALDNTVKKVKYLEALKDLGLTPDKAYVLSKVPVTPPIIRPVLPLPDGKLQVGDANLLYRDAFLANDGLEKVKEVLPDKELAAPRQHLYDAVSALFGIGEPVSPGVNKRDAKGYILAITGSRPGNGFFQSKIMKRLQTPSGRGVVSPGPELSMDEIGLPEDMAWTMYSKFIIGRLVRRGYPAVEAQRMVDDRTPIARDELINESKDRPVLVNRAPSLSRSNIVAAYPRLIGGKAIKIAPAYERGANLDYDGDCCFGHVILCISSSFFTDYGQKEADVLAWRHAEQQDEQMTARFKTVTGYLEGDRFFVCPLENFPHGALQFEKEHRAFYAVPEGIRVIAHDPSTGQLKLMKVSAWSVHKDRYVETVTLASGRQIVSDDDPRAVYGLTRELNTVRRRPAEAGGVFVPIARHLSPLDVCVSMMTSERQLRGNRPREQRLNSTISLTEGVGQLLGMLVGDGWVDELANGPSVVNLAAIEPAIQERYKTLLQEIFSLTPTVTHLTRKGEGFGPNSQKLAVGSVEYASLVAPLIGHGARNKHLPPFFLTAPEEFRRGLLAGLIDTDGSIAVSHGKAKPQWIINHCTTSIRLAQETVLLYKSLNVTATITTTKTPKGLDCWVVTPSSVELRKLGSLCVAHETKAQRFKAYFAEPIDKTASAYTRTDIVPIPLAIAKEARRLYGNKNATYTALSNAISDGYTTRHTAQRILSDHPTLRQQVDFIPWVNLVDNESISWDRVVSYEATNIRETGYDLTVPGSETFMAVDGTILSNTVQIHVPVTPAAVEDSKNITLSHLLFSDRNPRSLNIAPEMESIMGLHRATRPSSDKKTKSFASTEEALGAYHRGELDLNDPVKIDK